MARTHLTDLRGMADVYQIWNFDLFIDNIPGGGDGQAIAIVCKTTEHPGLQIDQVTVGLHGAEVNYAGRQIYTKQFTATYVETRDMVVTSAFRRWVEFARNMRENSGNYKSAYEARGRLVMYDDTASTVKELTLVGLFPIDVQAISLDGSTSGAAEQSVSFSFDYHEE